MKLRHQFFKLLTIVFNYLNSIDDSCLLPFLSDWPAKPFKTRTVSRRVLPVLSYLQGLNNNGDVEKTVKALKSCAENLYWDQTYTAKDVGSTFLRNYGWTELIGLRGPVVSSSIACGFLLLGPYVEYPKHSHEAEEVYLPLSSKTLWIRGKENWVERQRGVPVYHEPYLEHGMRTGEKPLLALYIWRGGNLIQKSHIA